MFRKTLIALALASLAVGTPSRRYRADEAKQLGTTLTAVGAEKAGNKDGTIPEYTGGLKDAPASFKKGSGIRPSPFESEKPRLVITARTPRRRGQADRGHEGAAQALSATMRLDVYPTQRVVALPAKVLANTAKNAVGTKSVNGGLGVAKTCCPASRSRFRRPATRRCGTTSCATRVSPTSRSTRTGTSTRPACRRSRPRATLTNEFPLFDPKRPDVRREGERSLLEDQGLYTGPARRAGEALMVIDSVNPIVQGRRAWQYLPGQRRVKLAPDLSYDTPNAGTAGTSTYSDAFVFNGAMDRFDWKLVGKKEMYVPYNGYKLMYAKDIKPALTPITSTPTSCAGSCIVSGSWKRRSAGPARSLQQARVFPRRRQLGRSRRRPVRRQGAALSLDAGEHDVQLRRERREHRQLHVQRLLLGLVRASSARRACRMAFATSIRCPSCSGRRSRSRGRDSADDTGLGRVTLRPCTPQAPFRTEHPALLRPLRSAIALPVGAAGFADVLVQPAAMSPLASKSLMQAVARAGTKLVAVGQRGHVLVSSDDGKTWRNRKCP